MSCDECHSKQRRRQRKRSECMTCIKKRARILGHQTCDFICISGMATESNTPSSTPWGSTLEYPSPTATATAVSATPPVGVAALSETAAVLPAPLVTATPTHKGGQAAVTPGSVSSVRRFGTPGTPVGSGPGVVSFDLSVLFKCALCQGLPHLHVYLLWISYRVHLPCSRGLPHLGRVCC